MTHELETLQREYEVHEIQSMQALLNGKRSLSRLRSFGPLSEIDKIFGADSEVDDNKDYEERKMLDTKISKGRFFGPPLEEHNATTFDLQNKRDTFKLRFYQSALTFYSRVVSMMESIIYESSSTHHSADFIKSSQKHILLKGKASNTVKILDELLDPKQNVAFPLESLFDDFITKLTGENPILKALWKWTVRNSKIMVAILKRIKVVEIFEETMNGGGGNFSFLQIFSLFWGVPSWQPIKHTSKSSERQETIS